MLAALAIATELTAAPIADTDYSWRSTIQPDGWTVTLMEAGYIQFIEAPLGDQVPGMPRVWVRTERKTPTPGRPSYSDRAMYQFNCLKAQVSVASLMFYVGQNLTGDSWREDDIPWFDIPPDSRVASLYRQVCPAK